MRAGIDEDADVALLVADGKDRLPSERSSDVIARLLQLTLMADIDPDPLPDVLHFQIEDRGALGYSALNDATQAFLKRAAQTPELGPTFSSYQINVPQLNVDLDRVKAKQLGVPVTDVFDTMQIGRAHV